MNFDLSIFSSGEAWIALLTLTFLEIVLGVDNIIFISILSNKLPEEKQKRTRIIGLGLALAFRVALLLGVTWIIQLSDPLFYLPWVTDSHGEDIGISVRDLILIAGGLFLLAKSTTEIFHKMEGQSDKEAGKKKPSTMFSVILQIVMLDMVFSFDSILTAIGLTEHVILMIIAVVVSIGVMMIFAGKISDFINKHPSLQVLALAFLILIGFMLVVEGVHIHVPKGYIYFAVFFSLLVEIVNLRVRKVRGKKEDPVELKKRIEE